MKTRHSRKTGLGAVVSAVLIAGCSSAYKAPELADELVWSSDGDDKRPGWTAHTVAQAREDRVYFIGMSDQHATQRGARDAALTDARRMITQHARTQVEDLIETREFSENAQAEIQNPEIIRERVTQELSEHAVQRMTHDQWRYEQWANEAGGASFFTAFVEVSVEGDSFDNIDQRLMEHIGTDEVEFGDEVAEAQ